MSRRHEYISKSNPLFLGLISNWMLSGDSSSTKRQVNTNCQSTTRQKGMARKANDIHSFQDLLLVLSAANQLVLEGSLFHYQLVPNGCRERSVQEFEIDCWLAVSWPATINSRIPRFFSFLWSLPDWIGDGLTNTIPIPISEEEGKKSGQGTGKSQNLSNSSSSFRALSLLFFPSFPNWKGLGKRERQWIREWR